ncbi:hypothetical protein A3H03_00595 [Candidatus Kuenenbacteria bacterium RIFCSPLOWO2_12_FULL_42_13]|uniref:Dephospho-CoA kinase n=5 Tax=Candidatus Kueneniibacteriota TaxID=1752740 RepID=A0A0G0Z012_9BACT|nr:MAG: hypothetical protein UV02_C0020G0020 [Candidatus Kuenenbacteria bacterium GW2011_GWA2_42_15]OGG89754.1 MAG: hypothetical protein A3H55_03615 [Candidatus Kuenenbacteria bacterium RIFCSPLOWO2_02_FULL_42_16]OGG91287.1 MAG: hypothetical protein A3H03_00595 [Candidatus Kuenenbacteria bacterium RIFCSPLOWO2_12_FULL_42_13]OGG98506.1 MAG: hypothetical protein A3E04_02670 [Candidatus Kuenenbacteria bacterium RIFCSPHIGHO2_12_FULL_42_14]
MERQKIIIGITGTLGAGKGTVVEYLKKKSFKHYSVREFLIKEIKRQGMPVNRDSMVEVANDLRKKFGPGYTAIELYKQAIKESDRAIVESIRTVGEVEALRKKGDFYLFAVEAKAELRYERIRKRNNETDQRTFEDFMADEKREMKFSDPAKQNLKKCIEMADFKFDNSGTLKDLEKQVQDVLREIE